MRLKHQVAVQFYQDLIYRRIERDEHTMVYVDDTETAISLNQFTKQRVIQAWRGLGFKAKVKADV
jgi:hypothetical protein